MLPSVARSAIVRCSRPGAEELDELADDAVLAQPLGDRQHEIGRRRAFGQRARSAGSRAPAESASRSADRASPPRLRCRRRPTPPRRARSPSSCASRCRRACRDTRACRRRSSSRHDDAREVLEVDLMDDAGVGRHDAEIAEGLLAPAQERVALLLRENSSSAFSCEARWPGRSSRPAPSDR